MRIAAARATIARPGIAAAGMERSGVGGARRRQADTRSAGYPDSECGDPPGRAVRRCAATSWWARVTSAPNRITTQAT